MPPNTDTIKSCASSPRVDRPARLGHPQRHAVVHEQREGVAELGATERALQLADHYRAEAAPGAGRAARARWVVTDRWINSQSLNTNYTHPLSKTGTDGLD
ncbi:hypothetical protein GCM10010307_47590 [Streptomyces vastus]|uniref:Uncharacterized protein n=1 Tax=Streptomyces vastus TaxID=285451 RepID=A0ABN3R4V9_9ACTN